jgi:hypothetical protein
MIIIMPSVINAEVNHVRKALAAPSAPKNQKNDVMQAHIEESAQRLTLVRLR